MTEPNEARLKRLRTRRNVARLGLKGARIAAARYAKLVKLLNRRITRLKQPEVPGMNPGGWHPDAIENQTKTPLSWSSGQPKLVWHTTEGSSLPAYSGSNPHFTLDFRNRKLYQHVPIRGGSYALQNLAGGVETNRAHAIQVELVGFSDAAFAARVGKSSLAVENWTDSDYAEIAKLARWIEKHAGVPRSCGVTFRDDSTHKVADFVNYTGHLGHQHVPENIHWDPSGAFKIGKVI